MTIATKNGSVILKSGSVAEGCGCCGGWYCIACETITPSVYSTTSFEDVCWEVYGGSRNPLSFGSGYATRCMTLNPTGDVVIAITATLSARPSNGATVAVGIGVSSDAISPFGVSGGTFNAISGFAIGYGENGQDRAQAGRLGSMSATASVEFANTISATFSRRGGRWYVSSLFLPEVEITTDPPQGGYLFHGVTGSNSQKVFSSYSITVS